MTKSASLSPLSMGHMAVAWRIARRELRVGLKGFRVFVACLSLGVAAIAAVGSLSEAVQAGLATDARRLLGGDVDFRTQHRPAAENAQAYLEANTSALSRVVEMKAMAQTTDRRALVELKAVDEHYPLVGRIDVSPVSPNGAASLHELLAERGGRFGAVADPGLLLKLGLKVGDEVRVGEARFKIRGEIAFEPDKITTVVNFGPRLMVAADALPTTGLVREGSQIHFRYRVLLPEGVTGKAFIEETENALPTVGWRVRGLDKAAPGIERFTDRFALFLSFAGMTALLVGGFGVLGAVQSYLETKLETIATLKCLGASGGLVFSAYLMQILVLAVLGIAIGLVTGAVLPLIGIELVRPYLPMQPVAGLYFQPLFQAAVFGVLVAVTFALWPLAQARETPAANLFRTLVVPHDAPPKRFYVVLFVLGVMALAGLVIVWAVERNFAYWFVAMSALTVLALNGGGRLTQHIARKWPKTKSAVMRLVIANLYRPGNATTRVVMSLGVGLSVLVGLALIQGNLAGQIRDQIPDIAPAFFFIDIQPGQVEAFDKTVLGVSGANDLQRRPSLRGRIVKINGVPVEEATIASGVRWAVRGDRALTYAATPAKGAQITKGEWWPQDYNGPPIISFDAGVAAGFGVDVGDTLTLNILGREITATIASLRRIDWTTLRFDFAIIFAPGVLENAPHTHIAAVKVPQSAEAKMEKTITDSFGNISTIRVRDALEAASNILAGIGAAVSGTASVTILAGIIVLAGTIAAGHARRVYDSVIFKVLGATRRQILGAFLIEFSILGAFTGVIGLIIGTLISWAVIRFLMHMQWTFYPDIAVITVLAAVFFTAAAGLIGTWRALGAKAARHLRNE